jgi:ABC-type polysaccharide/polyol phosphate transport system ATPase subunit
MSAPRRLGAVQDVRETPAAVLVDGVSKKFRLPEHQVHTFKERALHPFRRQRYHPLDALDNVSFSVRPGEFFGIAGRNGSGKSTLLKCLAGIYQVDHGTIHIAGRLSTFIELGVGFNPDLAARDNVVLNGVMLGLTPSQARERYDEVLDFAELHDFQELKLKNYSSGMQVRLAFSVMVHVDADVLLIDEVLAVGDVAFQQKCFDVFHRLRDDGKTIVFVTHDMSAVRRFCDRAMLMEKGVVRLIGEPERVADHYVELNFGRDRLAAEGEVEQADGVNAERFGDQRAQIVDAWFEDEHGQRERKVRQGAPCTFRARVHFEDEATDPAVAVVFENESHQPLFATSTEAVDEHTGTFPAGSEAVFSVSFENVFAPGRVFASPWIVYRGGSALMDRRPRMVSVIVTGTQRTGGMVDLPHDVSLDRADVALAREAGS